jgi:YYY domain-containing protein
MSDLTSALAFYLVSLLVAIAVLPLVVVLCSPLADRGTSIARPLSLLALVWPVWLLSSVFPDVFDISRRSLWIWLGLLALVSWTFGIRRKSIDRDIWRGAIRSELVVFASYVLYLGYRGFIPSANLFEQPFNLMMLSSTMKSNAVPPPDAWLSGYPINYYYLNYQILGSLAKMGDLTPWFSFNPALALTVGMVISCVAGLARNALAGVGIRKHLGRLTTLAVAIVVFLGTPYMAIRAFYDPEILESVMSRTEEIDRSYRLLPAEPVATITEPVWVSLRTANLHPHLMTLPYLATMLAIGLMFLIPASPLRTRTLALRAGICGIVIGALLPQNSWDYPTGVAIVAICILLGRHGEAAGYRIISVGMLVIVSIAAWIPFQLDLYTPLAADGDSLPAWLRDLPFVGDILRSIRFNDGPRSTFSQYFSFVGWFWAILLAFAVSAYLRDRSMRQRPGSDIAVALASVILIVISLVDSTPVVAAAGIPVVLAIAIILQRREISLDTAILALTALGFGFTIVTEYLFLDDIVGSRVNTVFKYYYQATLFLSLAAVLALAVMLPRVQVRVAWRATASVLVAIVSLMGSIGPIAGFRDIVIAQNPEVEWRGLDALQYVVDGNPGERAAIEWLWKNASSEDVMLAAGGCATQVEIGRPAAASGVPTLLGWAGHEWTWRFGNSIFTNDPETNQIGTIVRRALLIPDIFTNLRPANLSFYGITLIYVGSAETSGVPNASGTSGSEPFTNVCAPGPFPVVNDPAWPGEGWIEVFNEDGVRIYRRNNT